MHRIPASVQMLFVFTVWACGEEKPRITESQEQRISTLVELLASKNEGPNRNNRDGDAVRFPATYDRQSQAVVYLAMKQLLEEGSAAFDVLIENFEDKRYCYSYSSPNGTFDVTVGRACTEIMARMINCYGIEVELITRDQGDIYDIKNLKKWWRANRHRPLWEIQVEVLDEAIEFFENVDRETASTIHPDAKPLTEEKFDAGRRKNLRVLREIRTVILEREEAYVPKSLDHHMGVMIGLPWPTQALSK